MIWRVLKFIFMRDSTMKVETGGKSGTGLGDLVAELTHLTRLDKLAEGYTALTGEDCGCQARQEKLNNLISFEENAK